LRAYLDGLWSRPRRTSLATLVSRMPRISAASAPLNPSTGPWPRPPFVASTNLWKRSRGNIDICSLATNNGDAGACLVTGGLQRRRRAPRPDSVSPGSSSPSMAEVEGSSVGDGLPDVGTTGSRSQHQCLSDYRPASYRRVSAEGREAELGLRADRTGMRSPSHTGGLIWNGLRR
jgi:hypothetical protein